MQSRRHEGTKTTHEDHENTKTRNRVSRRNAKGTPIGSTRRPATQADVNGRKDRGRESPTIHMRLTSPILSTVVAPLRGAPSTREKLPFFFVSFVSFVTFVFFVFFVITRR